MLAVVRAGFDVCGPGVGARQRAGTYQTWRSEAAQTLIGRGDAESLATAAALAFAGASAHLKTDLAAQKSAAVELAAKSNELDPENPSIGWLRLQLCANTPGCDIRDAATSMRWVDADNGAAWMATLAVAQKEKDTVEVDRILTDMAQGVRFDLYWNRTVVLLFDALRKARSALPAKYLPSDVARLSEAIAGAGAEIIPPFTPLLSACRDPSGAERRENCLKLSKIMQRGDTVAGVFCAPEKPGSAPDPLRVGAEERGIRLFQLPSLKTNGECRPRAKSRNPYCRG